MTLDFAALETKRRRFIPAGEGDCIVNKEVLPQTTSVAARFDHNKMHLPNRLRYSSQVLAGIMSCLASCSFASEPEFLIDVEKPGVYRLSYEVLVDAGFPEQAVREDDLCMFFKDKVLPLRVVGKSAFEAGTQLEFEVPQLGSLDRNHCQFYRCALSLHGAPKETVVDGIQQIKGGKREVTILEEDLIRVIFPQGRYKPYESWYWKAISCLDAEPTEVNLPQERSLSGASLALDVRGSTSITQNLDSIDEHVMEIALDGHTIDVARWDGTFEHTINLKLPDISNKIGIHEPVLSFRVPLRRTKAGEIVGDLVYLNRVRIVWAESAGAEPTPGKVVRVSQRKLSTLRDPENQADYVMIACPPFVAGCQRLADFHRGRGLRVQVVNLSDVYDEFNGGTPNPDAIHRFLKLTHQTWTKPVPRFLLLVGDASYEPATSPESAKQFLPTYHIPIGASLVAADNTFACIGDVPIPDIAIGRFPVRTPEELEAVIEKTIACARRTTSETSEERMLWMSGTEDGFRYQVSKVIEWSTEETPLKSHHYVKEEGSGPETNVGTKQMIREQFKEGFTYAVFCGHGGRNWWRIGEPDLVNGTDLFSEIDLRRLEPGAYMPVLLGLTCVSAPFDHPVQGSLGEKFVLIRGTGAACLIGSSSRVPSSISTAGNFVDALARSATVGEAVMKAKRRMKRPEVEAYNLLGDPALPLRFQP